VTLASGCGSFRRIDPTVTRLIEHFGMTPLPVEATLFAETYRSVATTASGGPVGSAGIGLYSTDPLSRSLFHRLAHDEVWHFYAGDPIRLVLLHPDGSDEEVALGDPLEGRCPQTVVPAGVWQAGELVPGGTWGLFGVTMAPGFTGACFEGGKVAELLAAHPGRASDIERLGVPAGERPTMPEGFAA
jgi:predicted cupin superfamily sugar epimerase